MADALHTALAAALDAASLQAQAASAVMEWDWHFRSVEYEPVTLTHVLAQDPVSTLARVAADLRVLARHQAEESDGWVCAEDGCVACEEEDGHTSLGCTHCHDYEGSAIHWPCPDARDLAARYGVEVPS